MISVGIGEIQKNISIITNISEVIEVFDKRKKEKVAIIYPVNKNETIASLAGKYASRVSKNENLQDVKNEAMKIAMEEKYGKLD